MEEKENIGESERETLKHTKARYKALTLVLNVDSFVIFNFYKIKCYSVRFYVFDIRCTAVEIIFMFDRISSTTEKKKKHTSIIHFSVKFKRKENYLIFSSIFAVFLLTRS